MKTAISIGFGAADTTEANVLAVPVDTARKSLVSLPVELEAEIAAFSADADHKGKAGVVATLPRPLRQPSKILVVGVGDAENPGWRLAGAGLMRASAGLAGLTVLLPETIGDAALRDFLEGMLLADYRFTLVADKADDKPRLASATIALQETPGRVAALQAAIAVAGQTNFARDLTNMPSLIKSPLWFVEQVQAEASRVDGQLEVQQWDAAQLKEEGFGGILAVGGGSVHEPRLLQLSWNPPGATRHVVLIGKGITYDTGGNDIKPVDGMQLMRKDMGGAASVVGATLAAAQLNLPIRVTALAPLAENMLSGSAWRSSDVVTHYGGLTSEIHNTDAEGRVVLADALAYAAAQLEPDLMVDLATLTGASRVALGKKTAALFSDDEQIVAGLSKAAEAAGEYVWEMPLADDYMREVIADIGDLNNAAGNPGAITAALYLREFAGTARDRWAHIDMSAPSWSASTDGELAKGATGWGVRTLVRWLESLQTGGDK